MNQEVKIEDFEKIKVAALKHKGSFQELNLIYEQINKWIKNNNFSISGNYILRFDPEAIDLSSDNLIFELGVFVKDRVKNRSIVKIAEIPERDVISALYKGPYFNLSSVHGILKDYARKNDLAPMDSPTEIYLNDPLEVKYNDLLTEVQFTVLDFKPENINHVPLVNQIERKTIKKQKMVTMEHYGSIENLYKVRLDLVKWAEKNNIDVDAVHFKFYLNPKGISPRKMVFEVGLPVDDNFEENEFIKIVETPEHDALTALYKGPYINLPNVTRMMIDYAFENNLELIDFPEEIYLNSIFDVASEDLLTEVRMKVVDFKFDKNLQLEKEIERKTIQKHEIASIRQKGSFEKINKIKADLFDWIEKNHIKTSNHYFLRFHNHPRSLSQEEICYEVGTILDGNVEDFVKVIDLPRRKAISLTQKGSIATLKDSYDFIINYAKENHFEPLFSPACVFLEKIPNSYEEEVLINVRLHVRGE